MTIENLKRRLEQGKSFDHVYSSEGRQGLIAIWPHAGRYVLTWEESVPGAQMDESSYSRDERREFATADDVADYLQGNTEMNRLIELQMEGSVG